MSAHTPGPWTAQSLEPSTIGHDWVDGPDRRRVAVCSEIVGNSPHGYCAIVDTDEVAANARLIAAAPDLLAALEALLDNTDTAEPRKFDKALTWRGNDRKVREMAIAAIAAAKGETT